MNKLSLLFPLVLLAAAGCQATPPQSDGAAPFARFELFFDS